MTATQGRLQVYLDQKKVQVPSVDRSKRTVAELTTECGNRNIPVLSKDTKGVLIAKLEQQDRAGLVGKLTARQQRRLRKRGF